jgi:hypothetical protein
MVSAQTEYRRIRVKYIRGTIAALIDLLELPYKTLEKIPLQFFKKLKNSVEAELVWEKESEREMAGVAICGNGHRKLESSLRSLQREDGFV